MCTRDYIPYNIVLNILVFAGLYDTAGMSVTAYPLLSITIYMIMKKKISTLRNGEFTCLKQANNEQNTAVHPMPRNTNPTINGTVCL